MTSKLYTATICMIHICKYDTERTLFKCALLLECLIQTTGELPLYDSKNVQFTKGIVI